MDTRLHPRFPANLEVTITRLTSADASTPGTLIDLSAGGVRVALAHVLARGDILRLDIVDSQFWGHVVHVRAEAEGYRVGVEIERVLTGESELAQLLQRLLDESAPETLVPVECSSESD